MPSLTTEFDGVWTALITPFQASGEIDWSAFEKILDLQKNAKVTGVVLAGSTGEGPTLTVQEKLSSIRKARAYLGAGFRIMANVGGSDTRQSVELAKLAADAGADSLLVVTPPYNKPTLPGLKLHFSSVADATDLPICLYHIPGRTGQLLSVAQLVELCEIDKVKAVKEATGDLALFSLAKQSSGAAFLSGVDPTYLASLALGGRGVVSVVTNLMPEPFVQMTAAFWQGDYEKALDLHEKMYPLLQVLECETNPGPIKAAMFERGLCQNILRAPLVAIEASSQATIKGTLKSFF